MPRISLLRHLNDGTDRWHIVARVFRKWNVFHKGSSADIFCVTMVLLDKEGDKIQASVLTKSLHDKFRHSIIEGETYFFANFEVSANVSQYRATTHPFKITITPRTHVAEKIAIVPSYSYSFFPLAEIEKLNEKHNIEYLIDVLAFVKSIGTLEEYRRDNETKNKLRMVLSDIEYRTFHGINVECILFDECASDAFMSQLQNTQTPVVVLLNLARVGFSEDGRAQVCNSFNATRVFFNPPIKEVQLMIDSSKDNGSPSLSFLSQPVLTPLSQQSRTSINCNQSPIAISNIKDQPMGETFVIRCIIQKLETRYGWIYQGCSKCGTKLRLENESWICPSCQKKPEFIDHKMKLHYTVKDETGIASIIFWDKLAVELIKNSAAELKVILDEDPEEVDFPKNLDNPVGKSMLLTLKLNDYNKRHPSSSISVMQYHLCEDLMDQFTEASIEYSQPAVEQSQEHMNVTQGVPLIAEKDLVSQCVAEEDVTLSNMVNRVKAPPVKGRKRSVVRKNVEDAIAEGTNTGSSSSNEQKHVKTIKLEK
ncbi:uncharacterized protein LOC114754709 [Neltuma alba]|uniref:uncharacterized protein LOC114716494 n=1 Tax=Neltuma alba TaxID=207710 RepID=UPI0010A3F560|nr:uncharacterized protein LOC114716494 [Prosopis alba]XP_028791768.1 uncharacterized protein LOC114747585 [Prosopis alba]XP_028799354.1 uncharacterized protein LOC114754709 [Prosopis alba]